MICEKCKEEGKKSTVYAPMGGITTCMGWQDYYDEDGKYHSHNPNSSTSEYSCSNGHRWNVSQKHACNNCDYGNEPPSITWYTPNAVKEQG